MSWGVQTKVTFLEVRLRTAKVRILLPAGANDELDGTVARTFLSAPAFLQQLTRRLDLFLVSTVEVLLTIAMTWRFVGLRTSRKNEFCRAQIFAGVVRLMTSPE